MSFLKFKICAVFVISLVVTVFVGGCLDTHEKNHLKSEKSPYLQQHADNPIWWYPWGSKAFEVAKEKKLPIFLSVGYSTCHWCHVMEKESFEQKEVADVINKLFVAIKVDREERPDVDAIYMDAVYALNRSGGWPMTVIMTADGKPFFGATYIPKENLIKMLTQVSETWQKEPDKILKVAEEIGEWLKKDQHESFVGDLDNQLFVNFFATAFERFDRDYGGYIGQPKFPAAYDMRTLLRIHRRTGSKKPLEIVTKTLDEMSRRGIYDQLAGGFHRYSTDNMWQVPHFEKMLYDQASLLQAYTEAYQVTNKTEYKLVGKEIVDYILRDMTAPQGGFYSAEDADSDGQEGTFYVWTESEVKEILNENEFKEFQKAYGLSSKGNFEEKKNILELQKSFLRENRSDLLKSSLQKLNDVRRKRNRPLREEKILTSWNGLMIASMAKAGIIFKNETYVSAAAKAADFILKNNKKTSGHLFTRWIKGEAKYDGYLVDYAYLIDGLIELYQATFEKKWLTEAKALQKIQDELFLDSKSGTYFSTTSADKTLIRRKKDFFDNVQPAGNSVALLNLLHLADIFLEKDYRKKAANLLKGLPSAFKKHPSSFPYALMALDYSLDRSKEIAIIGDRSNAKTKELLTGITAPFNPNKVIALGLSEQIQIPLLGQKTMLGGKPTAYICENNVCKFPTADINKATSMASEYSKYDLSL